MHLGIGHDEAAWSQSLYVLWSFYKQCCFRVCPYKKDDVPWWWSASWRIFSGFVRPGKKFYLVGFGEEYNLTTSITSYLPTTSLRVWFEGELGRESGTGPLYCDMRNWDLKSGWSFCSLLFIWHNSPTHGSQWAFPPDVFVTEKQLWFSLWSRSQDVFDGVRAECFTFCPVSFTLLFGSCE